MQGLGFSLREVGELIQLRERKVITPLGAPSVPDLSVLVAGVFRNREVSHAEPFDATACSRRLGTDVAE